MNRIGEDHMLLRKQARDRQQEDNHKRLLMRLEMMKHAIKQQGTIRQVPDSIEPDETAPAA